MDITLDNVDRVLDTSSPVRLTRVFFKLLDPTQDRNFVLKYTDAIVARLETTRETESTGLSEFGKACMSAGIVKTMSELVKLYPQSREYPKETYMTQYNALASLCYLYYAAASTVEQCPLIDQFLAHDVYGAIVQVLHHPLCTLRFVAVEFITATACALPDNVTTQLNSQVAAEILFGSCQFALDGSERLKDQLNSPALAWAQDVPWKLGLVVPKDPNNVDRYFGRFQEYIIVSACWFFRAYQPFSCRNNLGILKSNPKVLDVLFDCATIPRSTHFPSTMVCTMACEMLALLFSWPPYVVPGVSTPMDAMLKTPEWKSLSQCLIILTSRKDWMEKIIDTWMSVEEEDYLKIQTMLRQNPPRSSLIRPDHDVIVLVAEYRGLIRTMILRLIAMLTHAADSCGVTDAQIQSLLRIAYTACHKISPKEECQSSSERLLHVERTIGDNEFSLAAEQIDCPRILFCIGTESVLGPIALTRLLIVLAQRKAIDTIHELKKPPKGLSSYTSLHHVQQIMHPVVIQRFLTIALQRVMECTEKGRSRFAKGQYEYAHNSFAFSAELAAALVAFDAPTEGQYGNHVRGARKELVIALSNLSAVALRQKHYLETQSFALGALKAAKNVPADEGLDQNIIEKCRRRIREALELDRDEGQ